MMGPWWRPATLFALVLALWLRDAEGLTFIEQKELPTASPTAALNPNAHQSVVDLSGSWQMRTEPDAAFQTVVLPGCFSDAQESAEFRKEFVLPDSLRGWNLQIHIPEMHYSTEIWLNGRFVSSFTGNHLGFSADLSRDHLRYGGSNELLLKIKNNLSADQSLPVFPQLMHLLNYGGILSAVYLRAVPAWSIEELSFIESAVKDSALMSGHATVRIARYSQIAALSDSATGSQSIRAHVLIFDSTGAVLVDGRSEVIGQGTGDRFQVPVSLPAFRPQYWQPDSPVLYKLSAYLISGQDTIHEFTQNIGFKRVRLQGERIYLNNSLLKIRAVDYIVEAANGGRAVAESRYVRDLDAMKELGINAIRVYGLAPPHRLVQLADERGFLLFVDTGFDRVPGEICARPKFKYILEHSYEQLLSQFHDYVSILAWNIGTELDYSHSGTNAAVAELREFIRERDSRPCFAEILEGAVGDSRADIEIIREDLDQSLGLDANAVAPAGSRSRPQIRSFGKRASLEEAAPSEQSAGFVNQAEALIRRVMSIDADAHLSGFCIHSFADYHGAHPLLAQPMPSDPLIYTYGIVNFHRQERISYFKLRDLAQTGQATAPIPVDTPEEPPLAFPAAGLGALVLLSIEMRRNNVFRQNLKRVFLHAHGFYSDLRYRRFLHTTQPLLLWFLEAVTLAVLLASLLHALRFSTYMDYVLTHFISWPTAKAALIGLIWSPPRSIIYFTAAFLGLILLLICCVRLLSIPFRERVDFWQSANYVIWALAALLYLLPVSVIFYRMLNSEQFAKWAGLIVGAALVWCVVRLLNAMRTGLGISTVRAYVTAAVLLLIIGGGAAFLLTNSRQTFAYLSYFQNVFGAH